jgi:glycerophosphoryl diester phosphodiesterase
MIRRVLAAAVPVALLSAPLAVPAAAATGCPEVVAHRTAALYAPEDTAVGITTAAGMGAPMVEMDVRWSASHYPVLMHDATLVRTTNGSGNVADSGLNAMTALLAQDYPPWKTDPRYANVHVPYAWDFVNASSKAGVDMLLDVKTVPVKADMDKLVEYVDRFGYRSHLVAMDSVAGVQAMHSLYPGLTYLVIEYPPPGYIRTGESVKAAGAGGYAVPYDRITPAAVAYWHSYGLAVYTWTSDNPAYDVPANWRKVTAAGVDVLVTNEPAKALADQAVTCGARPTTSPSTTSPPASAPAPSESNPPIP